MELTNFGTGVSLWDSTKFGDVEFSLYRVVFEPPITIPLDTAAVAQAVEDAALAGEALPYSAELVAYGNIGENGLLTLPNITPGTYVLIESVKPNTVTQQAAPMFLALPVTNSTGNGYLSDLHLYPKNKAVEVDLTFTKLKFGNNDTSATPYEGVVFDLYKASAQWWDGAPQLVSSDLITDELGKITLTDFSVGNYILVEKSNPLNYPILLERRFYADDFDRQNIFFSFNSDGTITYERKALWGYQLTSDLEDGIIINYDKPHVTMSSPNANSSFSFDIGEVINIQIDIDIPQDFENYPSAEIVINYPAPDNLVVDISSIVVTGLDTTSLDYQVTNTYNSFTIKCNPNQGSGTNGQDIKITFDAVLIPGINTGDVPNYAVVANYKSVPSVISQYQFDYSGQETLNFVTYEHTIIKQGKSLFDVNNNNIDLPGAEFIIGKSVEGVDNYLEQDAMGNNSWTTVKAHATVFITNSQGEISLKGLKEGTYFAEEIKVPAGYNLPLFNKTEFTISPHPINNGGETVIDNWEIVDLPMTGTIMTAAVVGGLSTLVGTALYFVIVKKDDEDEE